MNSQQIKELRDKLKLTQRKFGDKLGVDAVTVSRWELGTQRPCLLLHKKLRRLARKHGVPVTA